jgi:hypothetical protein
MTTEQRNLISNPAAGLLIYNTTRSFNYYDAGWKDFGTFAKCYSSDGLDDISTQSNIDMKVPAMIFSNVWKVFSVI